MYSHNLITTTTFLMANGQFFFLVIRMCFVSVYRALYSPFFLFFVFFFMYDKIKIIRYNDCRLKIHNPSNLFTVLKSRYDHVRIFFYYNLISIINQIYYNVIHSLGKLVC